MKITKKELNQIIENKVSCMLSEGEFKDLPQDLRATYNDISSAMFNHLKVLQRHKYKKAETEFRKIRDAFETSWDKKIEPNLK